MKLTGRTFEKRKLWEQILWSFLKTEIQSGVLIVCNSLWTVFVQRSILKLYSQSKTSTYKRDDFPSLMSLVTAYIREGSKNAIKRKQYENILIFRSNLFKYDIYKNFREKWFYRTLIDQYSNFCLPYNHNKIETVINVFCFCKRWQAHT